MDAFGTLIHGDDRIIAVTGVPPLDPGTQVEVIMDEGPMCQAMIDYGIRILILSLVLSAIVGTLIFVALQRLIVRPLGRLTGQLAHFRAMPEDESRVASASKRQDEIGIVERETARMQHDLRQALTQKTRLAGLGEAVSKLNHDLRNILSTAILISDRMEQSADPAVQEASPRLTIALERALNLCAATLDFARSRPRPLNLTLVSIHRLIENVCNDLDISSAGIEVTINLPDVQQLRIDRDEVHRVLMNLCRNAVQAMPDGGRLEFAERAAERNEFYVIDVTDTGGGLPQAVIKRLFEPFAFSSQAGGSGLGLAIALEIMKRHGGDLILRRSDEQGTSFSLVFPVRILIDPA